MLTRDVNGINISLTAAGKERLLAKGGRLSNRFSSGPSQLFSKVESSIKAFGPRNNGGRQVDVVIDAIDPGKTIWGRSVSTKSIEQIDLASEGELPLFKSQRFMLSALNHFAVFDVDGFDLASAVANTSKVAANITVSDDSGNTSFTRVERGGIGSVVSMTPGWKNWFGTNISGLLDHQFAASVTERLGRLTSAHSDLSAYKQDQSNAQGQIEKRDVVVFQPGIDDDPENEAFVSNALELFRDGVAGHQSQPFIAALSLRNLIESGIIASENDGTVNAFPSGAYNYAGTVGIDQESEARTDIFNRPHSDMWMWLMLQDCKTRKTLQCVDFGRSAKNEPTARMLGDDNPYVRALLALNNLLPARDVLAQMNADSAAA